MSDVMDDLSWSDRALYQSVAFGRIFPRRLLVFSALLSVLIGWVGGIAALLYFGFIDTIWSVNIATELASMWTFATFFLFIGLGCGLSAYLCYGLLSPSNIRNQHGILRNPVYYISYAASLVGLGLVIFGVVLFLNSLSAVLAVILAVSLTTFRYLMDGYWLYYSRNKRQAELFSMFLLAFPVFILGGLYSLGLFPNWSLSEWAVALMYATGANVGISGPTSAAANVVEDEIDHVGSTIAFIDMIESKHEQLQEEAPEGVTIDIEVPKSPDTFGKAIQAMETITAEEYPTLFDAYETYIAAYERLQSEFSGTVESRAVTGDEDDTGRFVARLARNVHPKHYADNEEATTAAETLSSVVNTYTNGYIEDIAGDIDTTQRERVAGEEGPEIERLHMIESQFDAAYA